MSAARSDVCRFWCVGLMLGLLCWAGCRPTSGSLGQVTSAPPVDATSVPAVATAAKANGASEAPPAGVASQQSSPPADASHKAGDGWPLFRGDSQSTGVARGSLPDKLERLWTFSVDDGGFESTAAIADRVVYVGCTNGRLYAVDLAGGGKKWEFSTELGFTASAAVRGGLVYIGDSDGRFYCIDGKTGQEKWHFDTDAEINAGANFYKDNVLFGSQNGVLYCLKADTGRQVWKYESEDQIRCFPTVVGDRAFVAGCNARLNIVDLLQGKRVADVDLEAPTLCTPAVLDRTAFVGTDGNVFFAIDWQKGEVLWRYENPERSFPFWSSAAVTAEAVIVGSRDKLVHAINPKSGLKLWTFPTKARVDSSPVLVGSRIFVGSADGCLYALDLKTGRELWRFEAGGSILASPAVAAGRLVIGTDDGDLYCFGAKESGGR